MILTSPTQRLPSSRGGSHSEVGGRRKPPRSRGWDSHLQPNRLPPSPITPRSPRVHTARSRRSGSEIGGSPRVHAAGILTSNLTSSHYPTITKKPPRLRGWELHHQPNLSHHPNITTKKPPRLRGREPHHQPNLSHHPNITPRSPRVYAAGSLTTNLTYRTTPTSRLRSPRVYAAGSFTTNLTSSQPLTPP